MSTAAHAELQSRGRLIFVLLESVHDSGLNPDSELEQQWYTLRRRVAATGAYEANALECYDLLKQIAAGGALSGTWIERRWLDIEQQLQM